MQKTYVAVLMYCQGVNLNQQQQNYIKSLKPDNGSMLAILDVKRGACTAEQPLRPNQRQDILRGYKNIFNLGVAEHLHIRDNQRWSLLLDETIEAHMPQGTTHIAFYAANSLADKYVGKYEVLRMDDIPGLTDVSLPVPVTTSTSNDFRQGIMYAEQRRFPLVYSTVDIALVNETVEYVLLGRKQDEKKWRFPGGFVDPTDISKEVAWCREREEEIPSGVVTYFDMEYVGSTIVPDCRYLGRDKIMTTMYGAVATFDIPSLKAGDDLVEVQLFKVGDDLYNEMTEDHHPQLKMFLIWAEKKRKALKGITY